MLRERSFWENIGGAAALCLFFAWILSADAQSPSQRADRSPEHQTENGATAYDHHPQRDRDVFDIINIVVTTVATVAIAAFTGRLYYSAKNAERMARTHERAYVFGGPGQRRRHVQKHASTLTGTEFEIVNIIGVIFTIGNYGRTPGFVTRVEWGRCSPDDWATKLSHERPLRFDHIVEYGAVLFPGSHQVEQPRIEYPTGGDTADHVFYGRITYTDVFKDEHHSVWRHLMHWNIDLPLPDWEPRALPGNNTEWD